VEIQVHLPHAPLGKPDLASRVSVPEARAPTSRRLAERPDDSNHEPPGTGTQALGRAWLASHRGLFLAVPLVIIPQAHNVLGNPAHADWLGTLRRLDDLR